MTQNPEILVVGATGLVGRALVRAWRRQGAGISGTTKRGKASGRLIELDVRDPKAVDRVLDMTAPTLVAIPAYNPFVDYCEQHPAETRAVNVAGVLGVARAARSRGADVVFFSSDYVFDGARGYYKEEDPVSPVNEYGRQKVEAEEEVRRLGGLVVRSAGAYGWHPDAKNFVLQVKTKLEKGERLAVTDVRYNPTNVDNLAEAVVRLTGLGKTGLYHVAGSERIVRREFAKLAARVWGLDESLVVPADATNAPPQPAKRPAESTLDTSKLEHDTGFKMWGAEKGLREMKASEQASRVEWENLLSS